MLFPYPKVFLTTADSNITTKGLERMQTVDFQRTLFPVSNLEGSETEANKQLGKEEKQRWGNREVPRHPLLPAQAARLDPAQSGK